MPIATVSPTLPKRRCNKGSRPNADFPENRASFALRRTAARLLDKRQGDRLLPVTPQNLNNIFERGVQRQHRAGPAFTAFPPLEFKQFRFLSRREAALQ